MDEKGLKYQKDPELFSKTFQAQRGYIGVDTLKKATLKEGDLIVALEIPNGGGNYFITVEDLQKYKLNVTDMCQGVQVSPFYNNNKDQNPKKIALYKPTARVYYVAQDTEVAIGATTQNPQYGKGGLTQIVVPHGAVLTKEAYENKERMDLPLRPINLADYRNDSILPNSVYERLEALEKEFSPYINKENGYLHLQNQELPKQVNEVIKTRTATHEGAAKINCALHDYEKELMRSDKDIDYLKELKEEIEEYKKDLSVLEEDLDKKNAKVLSNPELLKTVSKEEQAHLLDSTTCIPSQVVEQEVYLEQKVAYLEQQLPAHEKALLGIKDKETTFTQNPAMEQQISQMYGDITRDPDFDVREFAGRENVYEIHNPPYKWDLMHQYIGKEQLYQIQGLAGDKETQNFCKQNIQDIDSRIGELEHQWNKDLAQGNNSFDEKLKYMRQKTMEPIRCTTLTDPRNSSNMEKNISRLLENNKYPIPNKEQLTSISKVNSMSREISKAEQGLTAEATNKWNKETMEKMKKVAKLKQEKNALMKVKGLTELTKVSKSKMVR